VIDRRAGRIHQTDDLSRAISEKVDLSEMGVTFDLRSGAGHRAALAFRGDGLGACVSSNDPKKDGVVPLPFRELRDSVADRKTAAVLNSFVEQANAVLGDHRLNHDRQAEGLAPANTLLIRGAGEMGDYEPFPERWGLSGSVIAAATLIQGIGKAVGLQYVPVTGATGSVDTNLEGKVKAVRKELESREFVLLNIKGADEAGHDGRAKEKKEFIEKIDAVLGPLIGIEDCLLVICADHSTPCSIRDHSADPVPVVIRGEGVRTDSVRTFDEYACVGGGLLRLPGSALMPVICDLINRAKKYGA
jgi:2,3-bisphosphoglycerate-independent phosphoglycerate mutase